jgi:hypothetical protein
MHCSARFAVDHQAPVTTSDAQQLDESTLPFYGLPRLRRVSAQSTQRSGVVVSPDTMSHPSLVELRDLQAQLQEAQVHLQLCAEVQVVATVSLFEVAVAATFVLEGMKVGSEA